MKRRDFLTLCVVLVAGSAGMARAAPYADKVIAQLNKQGFSHIASETTWLGRMRITATRVDGQREIILNPRTGEILRDIWTRTGPAAASSPIIDDVGQTSGAGSDDGSGAGSAGGPDNGGDGSGTDGGTGGGGAGGGGAGGGGTDGGGAGGGGDGSEGGKEP